MAIFNQPQRESGKTTETAACDALAITGAALKDSREAQGLSLHDLASQLNMGDEQLKALETGDRPSLPEAVFIRAAVRRVANKLGLDPDPLIATLHDLDHIPTSTSAIPLPASRGRLTSKDGMPATDTDTPQRGGWGWLRVASGVLAVTAAVAAGWSWNRTANLDTPKPPQSNSEPVGVGSPLASPAPAPQVKRETTVTILTSEPSWIAIRNQSDELLFEGMINREKSLTTNEPLEIYAGRPDLVHVNLGRGQQGPLGPIDQVRWYPITAAPSPTGPTL